MSGFFCNSPRLQLLERQMRQPPGYRPRGQGWMFDMEEWKAGEIIRRLWTVSSAGCRWNI